MNTARKSFYALPCVLSFVRQSLRYVGLFLWALLSPKAVLSARLLAAESQLARCRGRIKQTRRHPRPRRASASLRPRRSVGFLQQWTSGFQRYPRIRGWHLAKSMRTTPHLWGGSSPSIRPAVSQIGYFRAQPSPRVRERYFHRPSFRIVHLLTEALASESRATCRHATTPDRRSAPPPSPRRGSRHRLLGFHWNVSL